MDSADAGRRAFLELPDMLMQFSDQAIGAFAHKISNILTG